MKDSNQIITDDDKNPARQRARMRTQKLQAAILAICLAGALSARAGLFLDFQDLSSLGSGSIPAGYMAFTWGGNWQFATDAGGNTYVFSSDASNVTLKRADGGLFSFEGAGFAGLSSADSVTVDGFRGDTLIGALQTGPLTTGFSTFLATGIVDIDTLVFTGTNWRMDNFADTIAVPEPATLIAGALLLLPFGASTIRFIRKTRTA
jgi:hypothetical protein